jgi:hypothetical protein
VNGTYHIQAYADDVNIVGDSIDTIQKHTESLLDTSKVVGMGGNPAKTKYMLMSPCKKTGQKHSIKIAKRSY